MQTAPTGVLYSHFQTSIPNLKWFNYDMSDGPTTSRTLTGAASGDVVLGVVGFKFFSAAGAQPKLTAPTIAWSIGAALIKFSNATSNMVVFGAWLDRNA